MSAILGVFNRRGTPIAAPELNAGMDAIAAYGSVGRVWTSGAVGLGCRLFRLTPVSSAEDLPLTIEALTITADARIDNRADLFTALSIPHEERAALPDSALILRAYQKWGEDCPRHLIGDYAFAIWDDNAQALFCARDHIGARPFYYYVSDGCFAFATDLRALLALEAIPAVIDEVEIAHYLLGYEVANDPLHTFYKDVYKLTFSHSLTVSSEQFRTARYWFPLDTAPVRLSRFEDYVEQVFELVRQATEDRLHTDLPVGAHFSGGLDSTSIAVIAARILKQQGRTLTTFSWSPPPGDHPSESEHARIAAVARQEGLTPLYTEMNDEDRYRIRAIDISLIPVNTIHREIVVQRKASTHGIPLILTGWGGDEFISFNGRGLAADWLIRGRWLKLANSLGLPSALLHPNRWRAALAKFWQKALVPLLPDALHYRLSAEHRARSAGSSFIDPDFLQRVSPLRASAPRMRTMAGVHATQARLFESGHLTARIESWTAIGSQYGVSYTHPLLDRRLMEFAFAIPGDLHSRDNAGRYLYLKTMMPLLPEVLMWGDVKVDAVLFANSKLTREELAAEQASWQNDERLQESCPWVDMPLLREVLSTNAGTSSGSGIGRAFKCLTIWQNHGEKTRAKPKNYDEASISKD